MSEPRDSGQASQASVASTPILMTYYTDPLCSWSWAFEPVWRRLCLEFGPRLRRQTRMGGLLANWHSYEDPLNSINRPSQMGPHWYQVRVTSGMPIDDRIWLEDPPDSSFPACLAVKGAESQGAAAGDRYLRRLREAVMLEQRNVSRRATLIALADEVEVELPGQFDAGRFARDLDAPTTLDAFRDDIKEARFREIGRFPTLTLQSPDGQGFIIVGYRPYPLLRDTLRALAPDLQPASRISDPVAFVIEWQSAVAHEVAEALEIPEPAVTSLLDAAVAAGTLSRSQRASVAPLYQANTDAKPIERPI